VASDADRLVPMAHAEAYAAEIPGARLVVVPGAHLLPIEQPDTVVDLISDLVSTPAAAPLP
jgi:pimeloyl-ACP methyl ester carboxylesterase